MPMATMADAHTEWHRNSGNPMYKTSCPWDACDPEAYYERRQYPTMDQIRQEYRAKFPRRAWGVLSTRLGLYLAANPPF